MFFRTEKCKFVDHGFASYWRCIVGISEETIDTHQSCWWRNNNSIKGSSGKGGGGGEIRGISLFLKEYSNFQSTCRHYPLLVFHCESLQPNHDVTLNETASLTQQVNVWSSALSHERNQKCLVADGWVMRPILSIRNRQNSMILNGQKVLQIFLHCCKTVTKSKASWLHRNNSRDYEYSNFQST